MANLKKDKEPWHNVPFGWYDVHFSLSGFMKIQAEDDKTAQDKAEQILSDMVPCVENIVKTGIGIEIGDVHDA